MSVPSARIPRISKMMKERIDKFLAITDPDELKVYNEAAVAIHEKINAAMYEKTKYFRGGGHKALRNPNDPDELLGDEITLIRDPNDPSKFYCLITLTKPEYSDGVDEFIAVPISVEEMIEIDAAYITENPPGRGRLHGFVEAPSASEAEKLAIALETEKLRSTAPTTEQFKLVSEALQKDFNIGDPNSIVAGFKKDLKDRLAMKYEKGANVKELTGKIKFSQIPGRHNAGHVFLSYELPAPMILNPEKYGNNKWDNEASIPVPYERIKILAAQYEQSLASSAALNQRALNLQQDFKRDREVSDRADSKQSQDSPAAQSKESPVSKRSDSPSFGESKQSQDVPAVTESNAPPDYAVEDPIGPPPAYVDDRPIGEKADSKLDQDRPSLPSPPAMVRFSNAPAVAATTQLDRYAASAHLNREGDSNETEKSKVILDKVLEKLMAKYGKESITRRLDKFLISPKPIEGKPNSHYLILQFQLNEGIKYLQTEISSAEINALALERKVWGSGKPDGVLSARALKLWTDKAASAEANITQAVIEKVLQDDPPAIEGDRKQAGDVEPERTTLTEKDKIFAEKLLKTAHTGGLAADAYDVMKAIRDELKAKNNGSFMVNGCKITIEPSASSPNSVKVSYSNYNHATQSNDQADIEVSLDKIQILSQGYAKLFPKDAEKVEASIAKPSAPNPPVRDAAQGEGKDNKDKPGGSAPRRT